VADIADEGFEAFVRARSSALLRTSVLLTGDVHHGQDLLQEALWRTHRHWSAASDNPEAYVRTVLVNLSHDRYRRAVRRVRETVLNATASYSSNDAVAELVERQELFQALRALPARQRATLVLRFWEDLSIQQTADLLGCSTGTVKSTTSKALLRLRDLISDPAAERLT
jgi:RNA polymerase sigma-70 factor (sigma-E family)